MLVIKFEWDAKQLELFKPYNFKFAQELDEAINIAGMLIRDTAKKEIQSGTRTGVTYRRGGRLSRRSAPGEFPKSDTGRLVASIRSDHSFLMSEVGTDVLYGLYLEDKSPDRGGRPWLVPSMVLNQDKIDNLISNVIKKSFNL